MSDRTNELDRDIESDNKSFVSHLIELRKRIFKALACIFLFLLLLMPFSDQLYLLLAEPLLKSLPDTSSMIATQVASPFLAPFKLTLFVAFFISVPYVFYQVWAFVAPGLYKGEAVSSALDGVRPLILFGCLFRLFCSVPFGFFFYRCCTNRCHGNDRYKPIFRFRLEVILRIWACFRSTSGDLSSYPLRVSEHRGSVAKRPYIIVSVFLSALHTSDNFTSYACSSYVASF